MQLTSRFDNLLRRLEAAASLVAALCLFAIMAIVAANVVMRYVFNQPFAWAEDVITLYLVTGLFFLSLPVTSRTRGHISVDIATSRLPPAGRRITEAIGAIIGIALWGAIGWLGWERMAASFAGGDRLIGAFTWPTWYSDAMVPIGVGLMILRLAFILVGHVLSLATRKAIVPAPPAHGSTELPE